MRTLHPFLLCAMVSFALLELPCRGATYYVDGAATGASDENAGTAKAPWKSITRAAQAPELKPGDVVVIRSGVYREHVDVTVSGVPNRPITFAAAPGARVVVKGSEIVRGKWRRVTEMPRTREPFPNAYAGIWAVHLGDEFFRDPRFSASYRDKMRRWVSQVFIDDRRALQKIGPSRIYSNDKVHKLRVVGRGLSEIVDESFFFDPTTQQLYVKISGNPSWFCIEVGVRGFCLTLANVHDVVVRGIEFRHNRQPGGQWAMAAVRNCRSIVLENCRFEFADFAGLALGRSKQCAVRGCDLSHNGNSGLAMGECEECRIENCTLLANNYRHFNAGWHAGGMKCIPRNRRCTVRQCEAAWNIASPGIWFDGGNGDVRILENVVHHNDGPGIFFEINDGGGIIADNLVYANAGRGVYVSGSRHTWIVHNTVAGNEAGVVCMPRGDDWPLEDVHILNNLLLCNGIAAEKIGRGCEITLYMGPEPGKRTVFGNHSDGNVLSNIAWTPTFRRDWNPNSTLQEWRTRFGEDLHSKIAPIDFERPGAGFRLVGDRPAAGAVLPDGLAWRPPPAPG
ncbi:MAG: hypothetical protein GXP31_00140, partial [Kiritimatiellaeota bacterium]|nr:hypothetical protein [Kiritimatiellota bacterium]